jgi:BirA family transcriptional regulator, biotin operon repressor / biotin---[acetyl-CoA-carboxylase] ligase
LSDAGASLPRRFTIQGWRVERYEELDSTSEEARRRAGAGDPGKLWILADRQTKGRGRHGRDWRSPLGNFYGSALLMAPCDMANAPQIGFVAGVALHAAAADLGARGVKLKWPNDLVADGAKLAGILLEGWSGAQGRFAVAVGIGVNLVSHPADLPYPATDVSARSGSAVSVRECLERLAQRFDEALDLFARGAGFAAVRERWLAAAAGIGEPLRATTSAGVREGLFEGLDARGRLLLRRQDAIETIESADIALLGTAPAGAPPMKV